MKVECECPRQALAQPLADQFGDRVGSIRHRLHVDRNRPIIHPFIIPHDVVRAGEDNALNPGQGRSVEDVGQGIEVGPVGASHGANSWPLAARWTTVSTPWKCVIQSLSRILKVSHDHVEIVFGGALSIRTKS